MWLMVAIPPHELCGLGSAVKSSIAALKLKNQLSFFEFIAQPVRKARCLGRCVRPSGLVIFIPAPRHGYVGRIEQVNRSKILHVPIAEFHVPPSPMALGRRLHRWIARGLALDVLNLILVPKANIKVRYPPTGFSPTTKVASPKAIMSLGLTTSLSFVGTMSKTLPPKPA